MAPKGFFIPNERIIAAIEGTGGLISDIARRAGCSIGTIEKRIEKVKSVRDAWLAEKIKINDIAVSTVIAAIKSGDLETAKWWIRMKMGEDFHETSKVVYEIDWDDTES